MYNFIINPNTNRKVNISSKLGKKILNNYINSMSGGTTCLTENCHYCEYKMDDKNCKLELYPGSVMNSKKSKTFLKNMDKDSENYCNFIKKAKRGSKRRSPDHCRRTRKALFLDTLDKNCKTGNYNECIKHLLFNKISTTENNNNFISKKIKFDKTNFDIFTNILQSILGYDTGTQILDKPLFLSNSVKLDTIWDSGKIKKSVWNTLNLKWKFNERSKTTKTNYPNSYNQKCFPFDLPTYKLSKDRFYSDPIKKSGIINFKDLSENLEKLNDKNFGSNNIGCTNAHKVETSTSGQQNKLDGIYNLYPDEISDDIDKNVVLYDYLLRIKESKYYDIIILNEKNEAEVTEIDEYTIKDWINNVIFHKETILSTIKFDDMFDELENITWALPDEDSNKIYLELEEMFKKKDYNWKNIFIKLYDNNWTTTGSPWFVAGLGPKIPLRYLLEKESYWVDLINNGLVDYLEPYKTSTNYMNCKNYNSCQLSGNQYTNLLKGNTNYYCRECLEIELIYMIFINDNFIKDVELTGNDDIPINVEELEKHVTKPEMLYNYLIIDKGTTINSIGSISGLFTEFNINPENEISIKIYPMTIENLASVSLKTVEETELYTYITTNDFSSFKSKKSQFKKLVYNEGIKTKIYPYRLVNFILLDEYNRATENILVEIKDTINKYCTEMEKYYLAMIDNGPSSDDIKNLKELFVLSQDESLDVLKIRIKNVLHTIGINPENLFHFHISPINENLTSIVCHYKAELSSQTDQIPDSAKKFTKYKYKPPDKEEYDVISWRKFVDEANKDEANKDEADTGISKYSLLVRLFHNATVILDKEDINNSYILFPRIKFAKHETKFSNEIDSVTVKGSKWPFAGPFALDDNSFGFKYYDLNYVEGRSPVWTLSSTEIPVVIDSSVNPDNLKDNTLNSLNRMIINIDVDNKIKNNEVDKNIGYSP